MDVNFRIRKASYTKDLDTIFELVNDNNGKDIFLNHLRLGEDKHDEKVKTFVEDAWVYVIEERVIGCVVMRSNIYENLIPKGWNIVEGLTVHPSYQGQGIGSKLMDFIEGLGFPLLLGVYEPHQRVQEFYKRRGYTAVKSIPVATWVSPEKLIDPDVKVVMFQKDIST